MAWFLVTIAVICIVVFFIFLKKKQDALEANFQNRFAGKISNAWINYVLYVAKESDGYSHFRGIGYLVLTENKLFFERQFDRKIIAIPVRSITKVDSTYRLGEQNPGKLMLKVGLKLRERKKMPLHGK